MADDPYDMAVESVAKAGNVVSLLDLKAPPPPPGGTDDGRPVIQVVAGEPDKITTLVERALAESVLPIFQRAQSLVVPVHHDVPASKGRMTIAAGFKALVVPSMVDHMAQAAQFKKWNAKAKELLPCDPPSSIASILLSRNGHWTLPRVAGVVTTPTIRPNGSVLTAAGYDAATRLYHVIDPALKMPFLSPRPTKEDGMRAIDFLSGLLSEFPFISDADRAVAFSGMISPIVRGILPCVPLHAFKASTAGTGKSYLTDLASAGATGRPCPVVAAGQTEEETEKRLVGMLLAAFPIISIDNVNGELGGDLLCQIVERPLVRVRPLGSSDIMEIETRATMFATGNSLRVRGDMTRRTMLCSLDANMERPELRDFEHNPLQFVMDNRGQFVAACLNIVRAYREAGYPGKLRSLASFEEWSDNVRSALVWLGMADPVDTMEAAREDDPELGEIKRVLGAWLTDYKFEPKTVSQLIEDTNRTEFDEDGKSHRPQEILREALLEIAGERQQINARRLGRWFMRHEGRLVTMETQDGQRLSVRLERAGVVCGSAVWKLSPPRK